MATTCSVCGRPVVTPDAWLAEDAGETCCSLLIARDRCNRLGYERERAARVAAEERAAKAEQERDDWKERAGQALASVFATRDRLDAARAEARTLRGLLREARAELDCGDTTAQGWNFGHWCSSCDDTVDRNMILRKKIDAALAGKEGSGAE